MKTIDINEANGNLIKLIDDLKNNVTDQYVLSCNDSPIAVIKLYNKKDEEDFPEIGGKDWDKLDNDMKKYWLDFADEEI